MGVIRVPNKRPVRQTHRRRRIFFGAGIGLAVLVVANVLLAAIYHNRTYPNTTMGTLKVGNASYGKVQAIAAAQTAANSPFTFTYGSQKLTLHLGDLGVQPDLTRTKASVAASRSWLALVAVFTHHVVAAPVGIDQTKLASNYPHLDETFYKTPVNAKVVLSGLKFGTTPPQNGYTVDHGKLAAAILRAIDDGHSAAAIPTAVRTPSITQKQASDNAKQLQASLNTPLTFAYGNGSQKPSASDIASWYTPANDTYQFNDFVVRTYIANAGLKLGVHAKGLSAAVASAEQAAKAHTAATVTLQPYAQTKTYAYCVAGRGTSADQVASLKNKLTSVYGDLRGWSLDGQVVFTYATSNCDFTVWLTSPDQMGTFGAICDNYWDCEVNNNVVVNLDRWNNATPSWNSYSSSLEDYRTMLIDHETGHMLGFYDNYTCPNPGGPAPIMLQQSIDLRGCTFNIWPSQVEIDKLRQMISLPAE